MDIFWYFIAGIAFLIFIRFGRALARVNAVQVHRHTSRQGREKPADRTHLGLLLSDLPIGLASFDADLRLDTFNPTFASLFSLSTDLLATRPQFETVFDDLRQRSALPMPKNFSAWIDSMKSLKHLDRGQIWHDVWQLPDGRSIDVQARSYPKGRIGLQFTDQTPTFRREQDFMVELGVLHQAIDKLEHGVAVFDTGGALAFTNTRADQIWGTNFAQALQTHMFQNLCEIWQSKSMPNPFWGDLSDFAKAKTNRSEWTAKVETLSGQQIDIRVSPLSQAALMCEFWLEE